MKENTLLALAGIGALGLVALSKKKKAIDSELSDSITS